MVALADSMTRPDHPAAPVLVIANRHEAGGLEKAAARGIPTAVVSHRGRPRPAFEAEMTGVLEAADVDLIALAGFMRILTPDFVARWAGRILNIHPSLLPKYPGLNTHARALEAGDREAGCSVHEVTEELDAGRILGQAHVPIQPGDTAETLAARVLVAEHQLYPAVLERVANGIRTPFVLP